MSQKPMRLRRYWCTPPLPVRPARRNGNVMKHLARTRRIVLAALAAVLLTMAGTAIATADDGSTWTAPAAAPSGDGMSWG